MVSLQTYPVAADKLGKSASKGIQGSFSLTLRCSFTGCNHAHNGLCSLGTVVVSALPRPIFALTGSTDPTNLADTSFSLFMEREYACMRDWAVACDSFDAGEVSLAHLLVC